MNADSLVGRLYVILSDMDWHDSYTISGLLWPHANRLAGLHQRVSELKELGCKIERSFEGQRPTPDLVNFPKRYWYRMAEVPDDVWDRALPLRRVDKQKDPIALPPVSLRKVFGDGIEWEIVPV